MALRICGKCGLEAKTEEDLNQFVPSRTCRFKRRNLCKKCKSKYKVEWNKNNKEHMHEYEIKYRRNNLINIRNNHNECLKKLRSLVIDRLSGVCVICGFSDPRALQIDHINGGGNRDVINCTDGLRYYRHLLKLSDEELYAKYQCLCANHNWIEKYNNNETKLRNILNSSVIVITGDNDRNC